MKGIIISCKGRLNIKKDVEHVCVVVLHVEDVPARGNITSGENMAI